MQSSPEYSGRRYLLTVLAWRVAAMVLIAFSIPLAHAATSGLYHRDGPAVFGLTIMSFAGGLIAALIYLVISTVLHFVIWRTSLRTKVWAEGLLLLCFVALLVYGNL